MDVIFKSDRLKNGYQLPTAPRSKSRPPPRPSKRGDNLMVEEDTEAFRKLQQAELARRGIAVSESTKKKKIPLITNERKVSVIEQNKIKSRLQK